MGLFLYFTPTGKLYPTAPVGGSGVTGSPGDDGESDWDSDWDSVWDSEGDSAVPGVSVDSSV